MKYRNLILVAAIAAIATMQTNAEEVGKLRANTCLGCHGIPSYTNVYPSYKVPRLAGQHKEYLIAALQAYRTGARSHPTMRTQARSLSEEDIAQVATYFSKMKSAKGDATATIPEMVKTQVATCVACHSNDGNSQVPLFPRIAGQHETYIYRALQDYKSGKRNSAIMLGIVANLSDEDMRAAAKYFASREGLGTISLSRFSE